MLEGVIPLETFPLVEWHYGELADVPSLTVLKTQICVTCPQCVKIKFPFYLPDEMQPPPTSNIVHIPSNAVQVDISREARH